MLRLPLPPRQSRNEGRSQKLTARHSCESGIPDWSFAGNAGRYRQCGLRLAGMTMCGVVTESFAQVSDSSLPDGSTLTGGTSTFLGGHRTEIRTETPKIPTTTPNAMPTGIL